MGIRVLIQETALAYNVDWQCLPVTILQFCEKWLLEELHVKLKEK